MRLRGHTAAEVEAVRNLTKQNRTQREIQERTGIPVRTQRLWKQRGYLGIEEAWPKERQWPGWGLDELGDLAGFETEAWEGNLALIRTSQAEGNRHVPWFYRSLVDLARAEGAYKKDDWTIATAALPALGHWLDCPDPCRDLADLIQEYHPGQGGTLGTVFARTDWLPPGRGNKERARYIRSAKGAGGALRKCIYEAQAQATLTDKYPDVKPPVPMLLGALYERIPIFDRVARASTYRRYSLGGILLKLFALPPITEGRQS